MRGKSRGAKKLALPDGPRWSKRGVSVTATRALIIYGAMAAIAVTVALVLRDGPAWEHPAPWLHLKKPAGVAASAALGFLLSLLAIAATRIVVSRFAWGRRLHRDLRPTARDLTTAQIFLLAGLSSLGEELLFRGVLTPAIGVVMSAALFGLAHQMGGPSRWVWVGWAIVVGIGLGAVFAATGSLLGPLLAHAITNTVNLAYLRDHDPHDDGEAAEVR
ncbi:MAG: CPBP family intramembrane glutamic endopeptidase [Polyangiaceae bacterium]